MSLRAMSMLLSPYRLKARAVTSRLPPQRKLDDQDASHTPKNILATPYRTIRLWRWLTLVSFLFLLATAFRAGWQRAETDFPNYYTAAVMVRKREPLRNYYDWTSFQREINYAGTERQLGGYYPNTPLTMVPLAGLTFLPVQRAKQIWLLCNLAFLIATVWLLSRASRFSFEQIWLLAFCGYFSLRTNFLYGQYYLLLLFLLTLAFYLLQKGQTSLSGLVTGVAFGLKLYGGPFLLFFVVRRKWKALAAMSGALAGLAILAIGLFGWSDVHYYATRVFPRSLEGNAIDPYTTAASTLSNLLRHAFVSEPELNPHPVWNQPGLFFFLNALSRLAIAGFVCIGLAMKPRSDRRDFAWFMLATILLSTNSASYMFILILLPLVLLLEDSGEKESIFWIASYVLLTLSPHPARLFPKVWILLAMVITIGVEYWRPLRPRLVVNLGLSCILIAFLVSRRQTLNYRKEPAMRFEPIAVEKGEVFSSFPAISRAGLFYQAIGKDRYVLHWLHDNRIEELLFDGHALHPLAPTPDGRIYFELVAHGVSRMMEFDPLKRSVAPSSTAVPLKDADSALSPDGKWVVFTSDTTGSKQVWLRDVATGGNSPLTGGNCNNSSPAWDLDSRSVVFASDCGRGFGLTALYRAPISGK
jgi:Glycosyltransferase family 87/WD40-like Beta Propeller Repeat